MLKLIIGLFLAQLQIVTFAFDNMGTFNVMSSTQLTGNSYYTENTAPGPDACKNACVNQVSCKAFMVDKRTGQCYIFTGTYGTQPNPSFDTSVLVSRTADNMDTFNVMLSTQLNGPNYYTENTAPGPDACKAACSQVSCKAFMVDKRTGQCYIFYGTYGTQPNPSFDSSALVSRTAGCMATWQTKPAQRGMIDGSVSVGWMPSRDECKNMCIQNAGCLSVDMIVFDDGHVNCFMQINKWNVDNAISINTYVWDSCVPQRLQQTGSKYYPGPDGTCSVKFNYITNKQAAGGYKTPETTDYRNCLLKCAKSKICRGVDTIFYINIQAVASCIFHYDPMEVLALGYPEQHILTKSCP